MEPTLPVWSIRPNWKGGILERLEWLTDVLTSSSGAEQRRSLRLSPRRSLEVTINPTQNERSFVDLLLHRQGSSDWLFPIWFDKARLSASVSAADERIEFDNTYREHGVGGLAILYKDAWTWEVVSIGGQDATGLDLDVPLDADWPKGTAVYPLRRARLQNETELRALSSRVGESVLLWTMVEANEYFAVMPGNHFEGMPVLVEAPNRSSDITTSHTRLAEDRDNQTGIPYRVDPTGRAFQVQSHSFMRHGRQAQSEFRSMLYWLRGRQRAVWIPSYNEDFVTSRSAANGALNLDIQKIGMSYAGQGAIIPGRDVIRVNGVSARVTALGAPQSPEEERLRIGAGLGAAVPAGRPGSFMAPARLNQDAVEIQHHTDTDGTMECSVTWKTFSDTREAGGTIYVPIPVGVKNILPCGIDFGEPQYLNVDAKAFGSGGGSVYVNALPEQFFYVTKPRISNDSNLLWDAWSAWSNDAGIGGGNSPVPGQTWDNRFYVYGKLYGGAEVLIYDPYQHGLSNLLYATADQAYDAVADLMPVVLTGYTQYRVTSPYDNNPADNRGGISLIAQIGTV